MNRRGFIGSLIGGVAAAAAVRTWPFRVYSFPSEVEVVNPYLQCVAYENDQILLSKFEQEGGLGLGSGTTWEKGPDGLPRVVKATRGRMIVTDVDHFLRTITLRSV